MFTSKSSDASLNSNANLVRSNKSNGMSVTSNEHNSGGRVAGLLNSSSSHMENQLRSVTAPIVSVISSSMDFFGSTESTDPQTMNNVDGTTTTRPRSITANLTGPISPSDIGKYGYMSNQLATDAKSKKAEQASSSKPKSIKRTIKSDDAATTNIQKKFKQSVEPTGEKGTHSVHPSDTEKHVLDMSFERAAVVAALTTLYGATSERLDSKLPSNTNSSTLDGTPVPMPLPKQSKNSSSQYSHKITSPSRPDDMVEKTLKEKPIINTADVKEVAQPIGHSQSEPGKNIPEVTENSTIKLGPHSSKKKSSKNNDSPTNTRKSSITQYPTQYDVLLGRGKSNKNHPGNVWFQDYIQANRDRYFNAPTNVQKRQITMEILETIRRKGRFLRRGAQGWVDVSTVDVQQKVAHALQYRRRCELREHTSPDSNNPHLSAISHPPHRSGSDSDSGKNVPSNNNNFDANAIALAMVSTAGNYSMAQLDAQTRQEQYKVNQEYYQSYLNNLQRPSVGINRKDARLGSVGNDANSDERVNSSLKQSQHPLYALPVSQAQRINQPRSLHPNNVSTIPDTSSSSTMSNLLLRRLSNIDYRNNAVLNNISAVTNLNPSIISHVVDSSSTTDEQQSSPPSSENLDSSGLHSLADVITQLCSNEGSDVTYPRGYTRG